MTDTDIIIAAPSGAPAEESERLRQAERVAEEAGLEICYFGGECNRCEEPEGRTWASVSRGMDFTEVNEYICEKCLPAYHAEHLKQLQYWEEYADAEFQRLEAAEAMEDFDTEPSPQGDSPAANAKLSDRD